MFDTMKMSHIYEVPVAIIPVLVPAQITQKLSIGRKKILAKIVLNYFNINRLSG
jgi:hypothetical protein